MHARTDGQTTRKHNTATGWADTQKFGSVIDRFVSGISDRNHCSTACSSGSLRVIVFTGSVQRVGAYGPSPPPCISLFALGRGCAQVTLRGGDKCPAQVTCKCHDFNSIRFSACQFGSIVVAHQSSAESAHRRSLNAMM